jgi:hypothetical protein
VSDSEAFASLPVFAFASEYSSQPVVKYTFFIEESDVADSHLHGAYNFSIPAKVVSPATGRTSSWVGIRADLAEISEQRGYSGNSWATGGRDRNLDFGIWGTELAMYPIGVASKWLYEKPRSSRRIEWRITCALAVPVPFLLTDLTPLRHCEAQRHGPWRWRPSPCVTLTSGNPLDYWGTIEILWVDMLLPPQ